MSSNRGAAAASIRRGVCPDCGAYDLHAGPRGGASLNLACFRCLTRFNVAVWGREIVFLEVTGTIGRTSSDLEQRDRALFEAARWTGP